MNARLLLMLNAAAFALLASPHADHAAGSWSWAAGSPAWADDDAEGGGDDEDDDAGGGDDADGGGGAGSGDADRGGDGASAEGRGGTEPDDPDPAQGSPEPQAPRGPQAPAPEALQRQLPDEIVVLGLGPADLSALLAEGYAIIAQESLPVLSRDLTRLRAPAGVTLEAARDRVRALPTGEDADLNHLYRTEQAAEPEAREEPTCEHVNCRGWEMIAWPLLPADARGCPVDVTIGMIDTGINAAHDLVAGADLEVLTLADGDLRPSSAIHGTAVASLLIGRPDGPVPGLVPEARLIAVDAFRRDGGDERADLVTILRGLDLLAGRGARIINLSLAGPDNRVLESSIEQLTQGERVLIVAAAGNGGPRGEVAYPAGYEETIAVTAVDASARAYRLAQRGAHVDIAAPGVEVLAATSISGARFQTGTSFATPVVTAAAALVLSRTPGLAPAEVAGILKDSARDLGAPGADEIFGHGLLQAGSFCESQGAQP